MTQAGSTILQSFFDELRKKPIILCALLVLATLLLYAGVAHHQFLTYDDYPYVVKNDNVNTGLNLHNVVWAFTSFHEANWHPVTWLSHMMDCQLFGLNSGPQHMVNVFLHAANALLLFWLLQRATGAVWRSLLVATLFAVHPLNVETVAWLAERKSLLCTLFSFLTIAAYGWYAGRPDWKKYLAVAAAFSLALMSKPMAVTIPIVLLLLDYWPLERYPDLPFRRKWVRLSLEKLPLLMMSAASSAVTIVAQRSGGALSDTAAVPVFLRLENASVSYAAYIRKMFWPTKLAVFYPLPEHSLPWFEVAGSVALLLAITAAVIYFHRARYLAVGWCLFVVTLIPVIGIIQVGRQSMADRYAYFPYIGLFIILAWGLNALASGTSALSRFAPPAAALCLILALSAATFRYLSYWQNSVALLTRASILADHPDISIEGALADAFLFSGQDDQAYQHYRKAIVLQRNFASGYYNMGAILLRQYRLKEALEQFELAGTYTDSKEQALSCLLASGQISYELGDYETAKLRTDSALQLDPTNNDALLLRQQLINRR